MPLTRRQSIAQLFAISALVFVFDQASKYWFLTVLDLPMRAPIRINEYFTLVMAWNRGVSFSMLAHMSIWMPVILTAAALIISSILAYLCLKTTHRLERIGYALVIGGALGNALDRMRFGAVADFFYVHVGTLGWPAFNIADMAICTGVGLLLLAMLRPSKA